MKQNYYKSNEKLKVYSGAPINKGFYERNLTKAHNLYVKKDWHPPGPKMMKKTHKKSFNQKIDNYMNDYKLLKQKFNLPELEEETKEIPIIETNTDEFEEKKILISNHILDDLEIYFDKNYFMNSDNIIDSMKDDKNFKVKNKDFSYLKNIPNTKDYEFRLYQKENELVEELNNDEIKNNFVNNEDIIDENNENKNNSMNDINNEAIIDENNDDQFDDNNKEQIIDNNEDEQIIENKDEDNYDNKINENGKNIEEEKINNENHINKDEILKNKNLNENNEYPFYESILRSDYNNEYVINTYCSDEYKKNLEEMEDITENIKNIKANEENKEEPDNEYENEFENEKKEEDEYENEFRKEENKIENMEEHDYENEFNDEKVKSEHESKILLDENEKNIEKEEKMENQYYDF